VLILKIVYSDPKTGKSNQVEVAQDLSHYLLNKKIGESIDASVFGLTGYTLRITGGTDKSGFAMHKSIDSAVKKQILDRSSADYKRRIVRGKIISQDIEQVNAVIEAYGSKPLAELFKPEGEKKPKEEKK
jgi:small subunit ribosomal protein S6e